MKRNQNSLACITRKGGVQYAIIKSTKAKLKTLTIGIPNLLVKSPGKCWSLTVSAKIFRISIAVREIHLSTTLIPISWTSASSMHRHTAYHHRRSFDASAECILVDGVCSNAHMILYRCENGGDRGKENMTKNKQEQSIMLYVVIVRFNWIGWAIVISVKCFVSSYWCKICLKEYKLRVVSRHFHVSGLFCLEKFLKFPIPDSNYDLLGVVTLLSFPIWYNVQSAEHC